MRGVSTSAEEKKGEQGAPASRRRPCSARTASAPKFRGRVSKRWVEDFVSRDCVEREGDDALGPRMLLRQPRRLPLMTVNLEPTREDVAVLLRLLRVKLGRQAVLEAVDEQP